MKSTKCTRSIKQKLLEELSDEELAVIREMTQRLATDRQRKVQKMAREVKGYQRRVARIDGEIKRRGRPA